MYYLIAAVIVVALVLLYFYWPQVKVALGMEKYQGMNSILGRFDCSKVWSEGLDPGQNRGNTVGDMFGVRLRTLIPPPPHAGDAFMS